MIPCADMSDTAVAVPAPSNPGDPVSLRNQLAFFKDSSPGRPWSSVGFAEDQRLPTGESRAPAGAMI